MTRLSIVGCLLFFTFFHSITKGQDNPNPIVGNDLKLFALPQESKEVGRLNDDFEKSLSTNQILKKQITDCSPGGILEEKMLIDICFASAMYSMYVAFFTLYPLLYDDFLFSLPIGAAGAWGTAWLAYTLHGKTCEQLEHTRRDVISELRRILLTQGYELSSTQPEAQIQQVVDARIISKDTCHYRDPAEYVLGVVPPAVKALGFVFSFISISLSFADNKYFAAVPYYLFF